MGVQATIIVYTHFTKKLWVWLFSLYISYNIITRKEIK